MTQRFVGKKARVENDLDLSIVSPSVDQDIDQNKDTHRFLSDKRAESVNALRLKTSRLGTLRVRSSDAADFDSQASQEKGDQKESQSFQRIKQSLNPRIGNRYDLKIDFDFDAVRGFCVSLTLFWFVLCAVYFVSGYDASVADMVAIVCLPPVLLWLLVRSIYPETSKSSAAQTMKDLEKLVVDKDHTIHETLVSIEKRGASVARVIGKADTQAEHVARVMRSGGQSLDHSIKKLEGYIQDVEARLSVRQLSLEKLGKRTIYDIEAASVSGQKAAEQLAALIEQGEGMAKRYQDMNKDVYSGTRGLIDQADGYIKELTVAAETLQKQCQNVERLGKTLQAPLDEVAHTVGDAVEKYNRMEKGLSEASEALDQSANQAVKSAAVASDLMDKQVKSITVLSANLSGQAQHMDMQLERQRTAWVSQMGEATTMMEKVRRRLDDEAMHLSTVSSTAVEDIQNAATDITDVHRDIAEVGRMVSDRVEGVRDVVGDIGPTLERGLSNVQDVQESLRDIEQRYKRLSHDGMKALSEAGAGFDQNLSDLKAGAAAAVAVMGAAGDGFKSAADVLSTESMAAHEQIKKMSEKIDGYGDKVNALSDQALSRMSGIQEQITDQYTELSGYVGQVLGQMQDVGRQFVQHTADLSNEGDLAVQKLALAGQAAREEAGVLSKATSRALRDIEVLSTKSRQDLAAIVTESCDAVERLKSDGAALQKHTDVVTQSMSKSLLDAQKQSKALCSQMDDMVSHSLSSIKGMEKSVQAMHAMMGRVEKAAQDVTDQVVNAEGKLKVEAEELIGISSAALEASYDTALNFKKQSETMFSAARKAEKTLAAIQDVTAEKKSGAFLSSARFALEGLHSLSVDIVRMSEGGVSEKVWKSFQDGDIAAFTRKMLSLVAHIPLEDVQDKFKADSDFRMAVLKYIRQFEALKEQAVEHDYEGILDYTFSSSDVGRLYSFLCRVAGRS